MTTNKKSYKLFLDDERIPTDVLNYKPLSIYNEHWLIVRNYHQFTDTIERYFEKFKMMPELISFDHDLADVHYSSMNKGGKINYDNVSEKTGYHCAKWLVEFCIDNDLKIPKYLVHSMNKVGGENIIKYLENAKKHLK